MDFETIQNEAFKTYRENLEFLKTHDEDLFKRVNLLETAINTGHTKAKHELEFKDGYFDILNTESNTFFYNQNSETYAKELVENQLNYDAEVNSFKTFYGVRYSDEVIETTKKASIYSSNQIGNAPIIHYVNQNLPDKQLMKTMPKLIVFGLGLGTHLSYLHTKVKPKIYLLIEPNLEIFRLSLYVIKYSNLAKMTRIVFAIGQDEQSFLKSFNNFYNQGFIYNHYFKLFMFTQNCDMYINTIQNQLVSQSHLIYSYDRVLNSLKRTVDYIIEDHKIISVENNQELKTFKKPILFLAAGPSLQNNIEFVKKHQDKYLIVAVYVTMPLLEKEGIVPDIITQYDEGTDIIMGTVNKLKDLSFFDNTIFLFSSHIYNQLMNTFKKENIFVYQAMIPVKGSRSAQTAPSIGELTYSLLLKFGAKNISMLGIDMALDQETNKTHIDGHGGSSAFKNIQEKEDSKNYSLRQNIVKIKGNFLPEVKTLPLYKMSVNSFNTITNSFKKEDCTIYNLSNGAFFNNTIPQEIDSIAIDKLEIIDKKTIKNELIDTFTDICEIGLTSEDIEYIEAKIEDAAKLQEELDNFLKVKKDSNLEIYEQRLGVIIDTLCFSKRKCNDLQVIIRNYIGHNAHYVYHLINMKGLDNPKRHVKQLNRFLHQQISKIIDAYLESYKRVLDSHKESES